VGAALCRLIAAYNLEDCIGPKRNGPGKIIADRMQLVTLTFDLSNFSNCFRMSGQMPPPPRQVITRIRHTHSLVKYPGPIRANFGFLLYDDGLHLLPFR